MITRYSPLFDGRTHLGAIANELRARVLIELCELRMPVEDIALSLNCSETHARALLASQYRSVCPASETVEVNFSSISGPHSGENSKVAMSLREPEALNPKMQAVFLAREISQWLKGFEASDQDIQLAMENSLSLLDKGPFDPSGKFRFQVWSIRHEIWSLLQPPEMRAGDREVAVVIGRWLAVWIRFWVLDRAVWERALGIAHARFEGPALAA